MDNRFSVAGVGREIARLLRDRWAGALLVILVFSLGLWILNTQLTASTIPILSSGGHPVLRPTLLKLLQITINALFAGALLQALLIGVDWRDRRGVLAPFRAMLVCFPAVFLVYLLVALPGMINVAVFASLAASGAFAPTREAATMASQVSLSVGVISLVIFTFLSSAPAAAVEERLDPVAAVLRGIHLARERGLVLFILYLAAVTLGGIFALVLVMLFSGAFPGLTSGGVKVPPQLVMLGLSFLPQILQVLGTAAIYRELKRLSDPSLEVAPNGKAAGV
ncbi:hypothetical protein BH10PSE3_BH10PSE3_12530 [soil metagenome]